MTSTFFFRAIGAQLSAYSIDVEGAALRPLSDVHLPAWVMYVWPHPSKPLLYVISSDGGPTGQAGELHHASVVQINPTTHAMTLMSTPVALRAPS